MSNPIYDQFGKTPNLLQRLQQFKNSLRGDPQEEVQKLLNSGKITQQQYNQAVQQANALQKMLGFK